MDFKIIAVDFDGTLCENKWPEIGAPNETLINYLKEEQRNGSKVILWTCRAGKILENAINWSKEHGIIFDAINENLPEVLDWMGGDSRKIYADVYIDDRNYDAISNKRELKNALIEVANINSHSGVSQNIYVIEECSELIKELTKAARKKEDGVKIVEEACDVLTTVVTLLYMYDIDDESIKKAMLFKCKRAIERYRTMGEL